MSQGAEITRPLLCQPAILILKVVGGVEGNSSDSKPVSTSVLPLSLGNATEVGEPQRNGVQKTPISLETNLNTFEWLLEESPKML